MEDDEHHAGERPQSLPYTHHGYLTVVRLQRSQVVHKNPLEQLTNWADSDALKWVTLELLLAVATGRSGIT